MTNVNTVTEHSGIQSAFIPSVDPTQALIAQMAALQSMQEETARQIAAMKDTRAQIVDNLQGQAEAHINQANQFLAQLNTLGFKYALVKLGPGMPAKGNGTTRNDGHCELCGIDGHDARSHRHQVVKAAFTQAELVARKLEGYPNGVQPDVAPEPSEPSTVTMPTAICAPTVA